MYVVFIVFRYINNAALFEMVCCRHMILHFLLLLCICPFAHYPCIDYIPRMVQRDKNCMCCSSWLQYRICHSLSTIQYVLVPQVQRQLQAALLHAAESRSRSRSRSDSRPRSPLQLRRGGRNYQAEGSPQDQLGNSQCQDSRETHTCQGEEDRTFLTWIFRNDGKSVVFKIWKIWRLEKSAWVWEEHLYVHDY